MNKQVDDIEDRVWSAAIATVEEAGPLPDSIKEAGPLTSVGRQIRL